MRNTNNTIESKKNLKSKGSKSVLKISWHEENNTLCGQSIGELPKISIYVSLSDLCKSHEAVIVNNTVLYACNLLRGHILKEIFSCPLPHTHTHTMVTTEVTNMLITLIVIISQGICISKHQLVYLKYM